MADRCLVFVRGHDRPTVVDLESGRRGVPDYVRRLPSGEVMEAAGLYDKPELALERWEAKQAKVEAPAVSSVEVLEVPAGWSISEPPPKTVRHAGGGGRGKGKKRPKEPKKGAKH